MSVVESVCKLPDETHRLAERDRTLAIETGAQRFSVDERHDEEHHARGLARIEQRQDMRMLQPRNESYFTNEAIIPRSRGELGEQHLDRDVPVMTDVAREIDRRHSAATKLTLDFVPAGERLRTTVVSGRRHHRPRCEPCGTGASQSARSHSRPEVIAELVRQITLSDRGHRELDVIGDPQNLHLDLVSEIDRYVTCAWIAVLWATDTSGVHKMNSPDFAVPRQVSVTKADHIAGPGAGSSAHFRQEVVTPLLVHIDRVESVVSMNEDQRWPRDVTAEGTKVDPERQRAEMTLCVVRGVPERPLV